MSCNFPIGTYRKDGSACYRPCGKCLGCRLDYSRQWAVRCYHEASLYDENCFITLTYNNENLPKDHSVHKSEIVKFMKKLRKKTNKKIRFFGCGEYGDEFHRPHYHLCLFNYDFADKEPFRSSSWKSNSKRWKRGQTDIVYVSDLLKKTWEKGFHTIGEVSFTSAGYVARYVTKKINGKMAEGHYKGRKPEFALMSRMPGIGKEWLEKYHTDVYPKDFLTINGKKFKPPKYYDYIYEKMFPKKFLEIKKQRIANEFESRKKNPTGESYRQYTKEKYRKCVTKTLNRRLENGK